MKLEMHEPGSGPLIENGALLGEAHLGVLWIDADYEPCIVCEVSGAFYPVLIENGSRARFPIHQAPLGTIVTLTQEKPL